MGNKDAVAHKLDAHGNIDIAGMKISFARKSVDGDWTTANDLFKHISADDLEKSITRGQADADALHTWFSSQASTPPYPGAPAGERLRVACSGSINGKPIVASPDGTLSLGQGMNGETPFISRNQNAIPPDKRRHEPTLISKEAIELGRKENPNRTRFPSDTLDNSHAEVAFLQNSHEGGLIKAGDTIRELVNSDGVGKEMVSIRGYTYDPTTVTQDFNLIIRMVKEFYETGDVS